MSNILTFLGFQSSPAVKKLLGWKMSSEDDEWTQKAMQGLLRKLKNSRGSIEALERALANPGSSECVIMERSRDGRTQICHKKAQPHVLSCRVWRWPDLTSHSELKPLECCKFPYSSRQDRVCINPYHYDRIQPPVYGQTVFPTVPHQSYSQLVSPSMLSSPDFQSVLQSGMYFSPSQHQQVQQRICATSPNDSQQFHQQMMLQCGYPSNSNNNNTSQPSPSSVISGSTTACVYKNDVMMTEEHAMLLADVYVAEENVVDFWATLQYHELNNPVGPSFKLRQDQVVIDGFTDPNPKLSEDNKDRICLGALVNLNRNSTTENTRRHIGKGVRMWREVNPDDGTMDVYLECLSGSSVFIQSAMCSHLNNYPDLSTVIKLPAPERNVYTGNDRTTSAMVFSSKQFDQWLDKAGEVGFEEVYRLQRSCSLHLSFAKGWGMQYHRKDITMTPCWLQITYASPLRALDAKLKQLEPMEAIESGTQ